MTGMAAADMEISIINFSSIQVEAMVRKDIRGYDNMNSIAYLLVDDAYPEFDEADDECYD